MRLKKAASAALAGVMVLSLAACGSSSEETTAAETQAEETTAAAETEAAEDASGEAEETAAATGEGIAPEDLKIGFVYIGDENEGYTAAHYAGAKEMQEALGLSDDQLIVKWNIPEDETAADAAMDLADQGCQIVFANSFGHESYIIEAAKEYPDVQFCHATGFQAASRSALQPGCSTSSKSVQIQISASSGTKSSDLFLALSNRHGCISSTCTFTPRLASNSGVPSAEPVSSTYTPSASRMDSTHLSTNLLSFLHMAYTQTFTYSPH